MELDDRDRWLQERYARWLDLCTRAAFLVSLCGFALYVTGAFAPFVPLDELARYWRLPLAQYLERTGAPSGWQWLFFVGYSDYLNYIGICLFALVILACNLAMLAPLARRGEKLLAGLALAQAAVLIAAASGLFAGG